MSSARLPILDSKDRIVHDVLSHRVVVLTAETGAGKTTMVPQFILGADPKASIAVIEPRRLAATEEAAHVSRIMGKEIGDAVGYIVRFDKRRTSTTRITYMTDGILLRMLSGDPALKKYNYVIVDEAHERSVDTDLCLGFLRRALAIRDDLRVIVMSATMNTRKFYDFFSSNLGSAPSLTTTEIHLPGRSFPVEKMHYQAEERIRNYVTEAVEAAFDWVRGCSKEQRGDVLVFLTGEEEIKRAVEITQQRIQAEIEADRQRLQREGLPTSSAAFRDDEGGILPKVLVYPLYSALDHSRKTPLFRAADPGTLRIVYSTNVAETSVTIPGIRCVVDSGFVKQKHADPLVMLEALVSTPVSRAQAEQRAGRAGRDSPGIAIRLYTKETFEGLNPETTPEIARSELSSQLLQLFHAGINPLFFPYIDRPARSTMLAALRLLTLLGFLAPSTKAAVPAPTEEAEEEAALLNGGTGCELYLAEAVEDTSAYLHQALDRIMDQILQIVNNVTNCPKALSPLGFVAAKFPIHPRQAKILLTGHALGVGLETAAIVAMLSVSMPIVMSNPLGHGRFTLSQGIKQQQLFVVDPDSDHATLFNAFARYQNHTIPNENFTEAGLSPANLESAYRAWCDLLRRLDRMIQAGILQPIPGKPNQQYTKMVCPQRMIPATKSLVLQAFIAGDFAQAAHWHKMANSPSFCYHVLRTETPVEIHGHSVLAGSIAGRILPSPLIIWEDLVVTSRTCVRVVSQVDAASLINSQPRLFPFGYYAHIPDAVPFPKGAAADYLMRVAKQLHGIESALLCEPTIDVMATQTARRVEAAAEVTAVPQTLNVISSDAFKWPSAAEDSDFPDPSPDVQTFADYRSSWWVHYQDFNEK